jgi:hypothetical protein
MNRGNSYLGSCQVRLVYALWEHEPARLKESNENLMFGAPYETEEVLRRRGNSRDKSNRGLLGDPEQAIGDYLGSWYFSYLEKQVECLLLFDTTVLRPCPPPPRAVIALLSA